MGRRREFLSSVSKKPGGLGGLDAHHPGKVNGPARVPEVPQVDPGADPGPRTARPPPLTAVIVDSGVFGILEGRVPL